MFNFNILNVVKTVDNVLELVADKLEIAINKAHKEIDVLQQSLLDLEVGIEKAQKYVDTLRNII